ncbi:hypothetical protein [Amazonocrinis nigriterrae]|nr:hypothetical protein [Amazonocrinis nigriterrae]
MPTLLRRYRYANTTALFPQRTGSLRPVLQSRILSPLGEAHPTG